MLWYGYGRIWYGMVCDKDVCFDLALLANIGQHEGQTERKPRSAHLHLKFEIQTKYSFQLSNYFMISSLKRDELYSSTYRCCLALYYYLCWANHF